MTIENPNDPRIPRECDLHVTAQELQAIYAGLDELPGKIGREVFNKISAQVQKQIDAALAPPAPSPPAEGEAPPP